MPCNSAPPGEGGLLRPVAEDLWQRCLGEVGEIYRAADVGRGAYSAKSVPADSIRKWKPVLRSQYAQIQCRAARLAGFPRWNLAWRHRWGGRPRLVPG